MSRQPEMRREFVSSLSSEGAFMKKLCLTTTALATTLALGLSANIAHAQQFTITGDVTFSGFPTPPTWNAGTLRVGFTGPGAVTISDGGVVNAVSTIIASVAGSTGALNFGAPAGSPPAPTGTIVTPTIAFGDGTGQIVFNHTDPLTVSALISGFGTVTQLSGTTTLTAPSFGNSYTGTTTVAGGTLQAGGQNVFGFASDITVQSGGTLNLNGFNQTFGSIFTPSPSGSLTNAGLINMGTGTPPGTVLTIDRLYIGQDGTIAMKTSLGADDSATDLIVVGAGALGVGGHTFLQFTNVGGEGAQTTDGILVVQTNAGASGGGPTAFSLANPELRAGAYDYMLFQGPVIPCPIQNIAPAATIDVCHSWYLRSTFSPEPSPPEPPPAPPPPVVEPPNVLPPEPPTPGPGLFPIIGPEIATYGVVQPMAQQLGRTMLGTHDDRLGDLYPAQPCEPTPPVYTKAPPLYTKAPATDCGTDGFRPAVWGRLFGQQIDNHYQAYADPRTDGQIAGLQIGFDAVRSDSLIDGHKDYGGLYFAYGNANVDVTGLVTNPAATAYVLQHTGAVNLNAYSGGAYWTHYGPQGWYVDLVLQGTSYSDAASTEFAHLDTSGTGFISSVEIGYPIAVPQLGFDFVLEPQEQVLWQWVGFDAGNDGLGPVALGTTSETTARVGVKGKWTITTDNGQVWQPYVRANFWSDFGGTATTMFGIDSVPLISHAQYMDVDAGFTTKIDTHLSAFADAGYQFAVSNDGGGQRNGVKGNAGLRYQW